MSFTFVIKTEKPKWKDVLEDIDAKYGKTLGLCIDQLRDDRTGIFVPILMKYCPFTDYKGKVKFLCQDVEVDCYPVTCDAFAYCFREDITYNELLHDFDNAMFAMGDYSFYEAVVEAKTVENGESKIFLSTLYPLLQSAQDVHILMLFNTESQSLLVGQTVEVLIDYLSAAGYRGSITVYDKRGRHQQFSNGVFVIKYVAKDYVIDGTSELSPTGDEITHVYDNTWYPTLTKDVHPYVPYEEINVRLTEGKSKFAYRVDGKTLVLRSGLKHHKEMNRALGGGWCYVKGSQVTISGTSTGVGPFREDMVKGALQEYDASIIPVKYARGRLTYDPDLKIFQEYPNARVSVRYYGEQYRRPPKTCIFDQIYYKGIEQRLVSNMDAMIADKSVGCGCTHCKFYDIIISNFKVYRDIQSVDYIKGMLSRLVQDRCMVMNGARFNTVCGQWITAARLYGTYEDASRAIQSRTGASFELVERAYRYLRNNNKISVRGCKVYTHPFKQYTVVRDDFNPTRYYCRGAPEKGYIVKKRSGYEVYDGYGLNVTKKLRDQLLIYRPNILEQNLDEVVNYFVKDFGYLFSTVVGYDVAVKGRRVCGMSEDYYYAIIKDPKDYLTLAEYNGWFLVRTR